MRLRVYSINGLLLNTTDYRTSLPDDEAVKQGRVNVTYINTQRGAARYGAKTREERHWRVYIEMLGNPSDQLNEIKQYLPVDEDDDEDKLLILEDIDNGNKQWFTFVTVGEQVKAENCVVIFDLVSGDGILRSVVDHTDTFAVSSSGTTHVVSPDPDGNADAYPVFTFAPSASKTAGWAYNRLVNTYRNSLVSHPNRPTDLTGGGWNTTTIINDTSRSYQINQGGGISNSTLTIPVDTAVGGGLPATGGLAYCGTEQILYDDITAGVMHVNANGRGYGGTTAATHADNAVLAWSRMIADGRDVRVIMDNAEIPYSWGTTTAGPNQTASKIWARVPYSPYLALTLLTAIAGAGAIAEITFPKTKATQILLKSLADTGIKTLLIGSEKFTFVDIDERDCKVTDVTRGVDGTAEAAHASGVAVILLEHTIWVLYGNPTAETPSYDPNTVPIFNLQSSTNSSWVYDNLGSLSGQRPGSFLPGVVRQARDNESGTYTANHNTDADPFSEIGMRIKSFLFGGRYQRPAAELLWQLYHPDSISQTSCAGEVYRAGTLWPAIAALEYTNNTKKWTAAWNESSPGTPSSWTAITHNTVTMTGNPKYIRFHLQGNCSEGSGNMAALEIESMTLVLVEYPTVSFGAEQSAYEINAKITLVETGEFFLFNQTVKLTQSVVVDCFEADTYIFQDNSPAAIPNPDTDRAYWLRLISGQNNTIKYEDLSGVVGGLDFGIEFKDRLR